MPGGVGISHITAYDWPAADGVCSGSPHLHLACAEAYVVTAGEGEVQTLTPFLPEGGSEPGGGTAGSRPPDAGAAPEPRGYRAHPLTPGAVVWFTPGTVHRMVNRGGLRVTVVMQNSGLPEAGDAVLTLPPEHLVDTETYARAVALPPPDDPAVGEAARRRRDLAVAGYTELRRALEAGDDGPLREFRAAAARLVAPRVAAWRERWRAGAMEAALRTGRVLDALERGEEPDPVASRVRAVEPTRHGGWGMCGRRQEYEVPGTTVPRRPSEG
ncbi:cupin [Streptomyces sp. ST2-7A]|uniref:cupin n=1 Tax=Streptomyces sp. ST2-7A TaxID=2907214 RepID=UPI001F1F78A0|nr:cupin [Streptomyces sp. ST2-7A]MCE7081931.1 cupin [Streptomyces sp. ST2-7A]